MDSIHRFRRNEWLIYTIGWGIVIVLCMLHIMSANAAESHPTFTIRDLNRLLYALVPLICLFAVNNWVLMPRLLARGRVWSYVGAITVGIILVALWQFADYIQAAPHPGESNDLCVVATDMEPPRRPPHPGENALLPMPLIHDLICAALVVGVNLAVSLVSRQMLSNIERDKMLATQNAERIEQLKTQINPHFYMNMLNNIHGLVDTDPTRAKGMIIDMSRLMQYMLYDSSKSSIPLSDEIAFLQDYLRVMERRYPSDKVRVSVSLPQTMQCRGLEVPPLLFLVFIENAFKHGIDYRTDSYVTIHMDIDENEIIHFSCINSVPHMPSTTRKGGIGLENIKTRLQLIYGSEATLIIDKSELTYRVSLTIPAYETSHIDNR